MKIYDIIAETKQNTEEGITSTLLSPLVKGAAKTVKPVADKLTARAGAKQLARSSKEAEYAANLKVLSTVFGPTTNALIKLSYAWGIGKPMIDAGMSMAQLKKQLEAGQISEEQYDARVRGVLGKCTTEILAIGAFNVALKAGAGIVRSIPFPGTSALANLANKMTPAASAAFGAWLATPGPLGGQKVFTEWFVGESLSASVARDWLGSLTKNLYDTLVNKATEISTGKPTPSTTAADTNVLPLDKSTVDGAASQTAPTGPAAVQRDMYTGARLN